jgi:hypothetical protein
MSLMLRVSVTIPLPADEFEKAGELVKLRPAIDRFRESLPQEASVDVKIFTPRTRGEAEPKKRGRPKLAAAE